MGSQHAPGQPLQTAGGVVRQSGNLRTGNKARWRVEKPGSRQDFCLVTIFALGIMEGALRKWVIPETSRELAYVAYFVKDVPFVLLWLMLPVRRVGPVVRRFGRFVVPATALTVAGILLTALQSVDPVGAVLTVRSLLVTPLLAYAVARRLEGVSLSRVAMWVAALSFVPAITGVVQSSLPASHPINEYVGGAAPIVYGTRVRAAGTFSFISGMASMSILATWAGLVLLTQRQSSLVIRIFGAGAVVAALVCSGTAVSRSGIFLTLAMVGSVIVLSRWSARVLIPLLVVIAVSANADFEAHSMADSQITPTFRVLAQGVVERHLTGDSILERVTMWVKELGDALMAWPAGQGLGGGQTGAAAVTRGTHGLFVFEFELARIVLEAGAFGLIGAVLFRVGAIVALFGLWLRVRSGRRFLDLLVCCLATTAFFLRNVAFDHVAAGFVWPLLALTLAWGDSLYRHGRTRVGDHGAAHKRERSPGGARSVQ